MTFRPVLRDDDSGGDIPPATDYPVEYASQDYFDPNATDDQWPGVVGLQMRVHTWWQGDEEWDTYEALGPTDESAQTQDPNAAADTGADEPAPLGGAKPAGTGHIRTDVPAVNGIPLTWCEEDGIVGDLIGAESNTIQILLQGVQDIGDFYFPVNPEEISCEFGEDNDYDTDAIGIGELTIPGTPRLESISWSSFLPARFDDGYVSIDSGLTHDPNYAMQKLIESKRSRLIMFLTIGGTPWNDYVILKSLKWSSHAGEVGDIFYDITFKRYVDVTIQTVEVPGAGVSDPRDEPVNQPPNQDTGQPDTGPTDDNPSGSDDTNKTEVPTNVPPTDTASSHPTPAATVPDSLNRVGAAQGDTVTTTQYVVGPNESIQDAYDNIVRMGYGDYNKSPSSLFDENVNAPVSIFDMSGDPSQAPLNPTRKTKVGDFSMYDKLPMGTYLTYHKPQKVVHMANVNGDAPLLGPGGLISSQNPPDLPPYAGGGEESLPPYAR